MEVKGILFVVLVVESGFADTGEYYYALYSVYGVSINKNSAVFLGYCGFLKMNKTINAKEKIQL